MPIHTRNRSGPIALPEDNNAVSKKVSFFGMVAIVMTALHLKDKWDEYRQVPSDPEADPAFPAPATYTDVDEEGNPINLSTGAEHDDDDILNTEVIIPPRQKTKRKKNNCCMCCGINCALFWKAVGIVLLVTLIWNVFKLVVWVVTPSPTGLEDMPKYSESLGCMDAKFFYQDKQTQDFLVPIQSGAMEFKVNGAFNGTILLEPGASGEPDLHVAFSARTNKQSVKDEITVSLPNSIVGDITMITTPFIPISDTRSCGRFDITLYIPQELQTLTINARSITHLKFSDNFKAAPTTLKKLEVNLLSSSGDNMLLPTSYLEANDLSTQVNEGYLVGDLTIQDTTSITTLGNAITKLRLLTSTSSENPTDGRFSEAKLTTRTSSGRSDFTYITQTQRRIQSTHESTFAGDLYLTYKEANFNGQVDMRAKSWTAKGLEGTMPAFPGQGNGDGKNPLPWHGDKNVGDFVKVQSPGWVGLYF